MASTIAAIGHSRRWSWDDDEDDDFDLDAWKATVDTSSPSAHDLGPLQLPPCEEKIENVVITSLECHNYPDEYWETPDLDMQDMAEEPWPIIVSEHECTFEPEAEEVSPEATYDNIIDMILEEQLAIARHQYLTHAIGIYFEGKDEADAPAYPGLSLYNGQRYRYAKAFQSIKYANGRRQGEVYQHSPLVLVTSIDDAHLTDEESCHDEFCPSRYEEETLDDILSYEDEDPELDITQVDFTVTFDESPKNATEQVKLQRLPALDYFSRGELKELVGMWKAQQDKDAEDGLENEDEEDLSSIDTWERSDIDEEEMSELPGIEYESDPSRFSVRPPKSEFSPCNNEELDFNDVVFCVDSDIENRDEGYVSSSPPNSPDVDLFTDGCEQQTEHSETPDRPKGAMRVDSMDALDSLGVAEEQTKASTYSGDEDSNPIETEETSHHSINVNNNGKAQLLDTVENLDFAAQVFGSHNLQSSTLDITNTTDACTSSKHTPTPLPHLDATIYTQLEQKNSRRPFKIQFASLSSMFFNGLALHPHVSLDEQ